MVQKIVLNIPGKPLGKARPRVTRRGITYTPKPTVEREKLVRACCEEKYKDEPPLDGPLSVTITAVYPVPVSASAAKKREMHGGAVLPLIRPDVDNVAKLILDALNGRAYADDSQVVSLTASKRYAKDGEEAHTEVSIFAVGSL